MSRRNTISREFFSTIAVVLVLGLSVMCAIQTALSAAYFVQERRTALNDILNGASKLCETFAEDGSVLTRPLDNEQARENARNGFDLFTTSSGAVLFVTDENGDILLHTGSGMALTGTANSTSGSTLEGVQVAILDENDKIVQSAQAQVGGTSFSLKTLDDQIHFGELPTGCYTYMVIVTETSGETLCFASDFTVSDAATSTITYWSVQDPDGTKLTDQTITATAEETIQSTLGWLSGLFG